MQGASLPPYVARTAVGLEQMIMAQPAFVMRRRHDARPAAVRLQDSCVDNQTEMSVHGCAGCGWSVPNARGRFDRIESIVGNVSHTGAADGADVLVAEAIDAVTAGLGAACRGFQIPADPRTLG